MSVRLMAWVFENSDTTGNDRLVLLALADEADDDGTNAHPGIARIARKARVNERTTMRCIDRLEAEGLIVVTRPERKGRGHFNTYVVVVPEKPDTLSPFASTETPIKPAEHRERPRTPSQTVVDPLTHVLKGSLSPLAERVLELVENESSSEEPAALLAIPPKPRKPPKRNAMSVAFIEALGWNEPLPAKAVVRLNLAVKALRDQLGVEDPDTVHAAVAAYRRQWPSWTCSPQAVVSHWHELRLPKNPTVTPMPAEPWKDHANG